MPLRLSILIAVLLTSLTGCGHHTRLTDMVWVPSPEPMQARTDEPPAGRDDVVLMPANLKGTMPIGPTAAPDGPYLLDTGDRLRIFVYGQPNLSRLYTVVARRTEPIRS